MDYHDLEGWKESKELVKLVSYITNKLAPSKQFGLVLQICRAAISIPLNIAQGIGRMHTRESVQFLNISRGSLFELEDHLIISKELFSWYVEEFSLPLGKTRTCKKLLNGFIN